MRTHSRSTATTTSPLRSGTAVTLATDPDANILAFGSSYTGNYPDYDFFVRKHSPQGDVI